MFRPRLCSVALVLLGLWSGVAHAALTVSPSTQAFGDRLIQPTAATIAEAVEGDGALASIVVTGTGCGGGVVTVVPTSPETLPRVITAGTPMPITISFKPAARGAVTCIVDLRDAVAASLGSFTVTGTGVAPEIGFPASTSFGNVRVASAAFANQDIVISNAGDAGQNLSITALSTTGDYSIVMQPTLPATVTPGNSVTVQVKFDPALSGTRNGNLNITSNDPITPNVQAGLTGTGTNATISVNNVAFGTVTNTTTLTKDITITNTAAAPVGPLHVASATMSGGSWFTFDTNGGANCQGMTSCSFVGLDVTTTATVQVRCSPPFASSGMQTATVAFTHDGDVQPGANQSTLTCFSSGMPSIMGPPNLAFGDVELGKQSGSMPITITNNGSSPLTITSAVVQAGTSDYAATGTAGMQIVPVGGMATWNVVCHPTLQGSRPGNFQILSNAANAPTFDVPLSCNGTRGNLTVTSPLPFGGVAQDTVSMMNVTLRNTGNLTVTNIGSSSDNAAYTVVAATLPSMLTAGGMATVTIRFAPTSTNPGGNGNITFSGVWGAIPQTATTAVLQVSGTSLTIGVTLSTATVDFGNFRFDTQPTRTFCITNTGQAAVIINSPITFVPTGGTASTEVAITTLRKQATCNVGGSTAMLPVTLNATEVLEVTVRAQPVNRTGAVTGNVNISTNLPTNPNKTVAVTGNSITGMLTVLPGSIVQFGTVDIQGTPVTIMVRLRNTGVAPIDLASFARTANPAFTFTLPGNSTVMPNNEVMFSVTYAPTVANPSDEIVTVTHSVAGDIAAPTMMNTIQLRGRGIDRDLEIVGALPVFPDTFRNPGSDGPVRTIGVHNKGTAPLQVAAVMVSNDADVWKVLDPDPIVIPPDATADIRVRFEPRAPGRSEARLQIVNDDDDDGPPITTKTTEVNLSGQCVDRRVSFNPSLINAGFVEIGDKLTIPDALIITSMDDASVFTIQTIMIDGGDGAFAVEDVVDGLTLDRVSIERRFDVSFAPKTPGQFTGKVRLFLDKDPQVQSEIDIEGTAVFVDARGGGGCSTGSGHGFGAILLVLCVLLRKRRAALIALSCIAPAMARADDNVLLSVFDPTPQTTNDGFQLQSGLVGAHGSWVVTALYSYASDPLLHLASAGGNAGVITGSSMIELGGAVGLLDRFEVGAHMPFYSQTGEALGDQKTEYTTAPAEGTATGDLRLHGKVSVVNRPLSGNGVLAVGAGLVLTLPTATDGMLTGADRPSIRALALGTLVPGAFSNRLTISVNAGGIVRAAAKYRNLEQKSGVQFGLGTSIRVIDPLWIIGEMFGEFVPSGRDTMDGSSTTLSPIEWLGGLRVQPDRRFAISLAAGRGLTSAAGAPALRGVFVLTFTPQADELRPIHAPPPPKADVDTDRDRIVDRLDKCDNEPEDIDLFEDTDGCPDLDNDNDGIADANDKCPLEPEDKDNHDDLDGCVDKDNDGDGLADANDKCPNDAEDKDAYQDADGCPEPDNDLDGILDASDKCPNEREVINGTQDDDGCPDAGIALVIVTPDRLELMESFQWTKDTKLTGKSFNLLGQVAGHLRQHPEILKIRVGVHMHPRDTAKDQVISDQRAQAIKEWLVQWGIDAKRIDIRGFGGTKPVGTSAGANERVEFVIMDKK